MYNKTNKQIKKTYVSDRKNQPFGQYTKPLDSDKKFFSVIKRHNS